MLVGLTGAGIAGFYLSKGNALVIGFIILGMILAALIFLMLSVFIYSYGDLVDKVCVIEKHLRPVGYDPEDDTYLEDGIRYRK